MGIEPIRGFMARTTVLKTARHTSYPFTSTLWVILPNGIYFCKQKQNRANVSIKEVSCLFEDLDCPVALTFVDEDNRPCTAHSAFCVDARLV